MPFEEVNRMDQKQSFIRDYLTEEWTFSSLCKAYSISRRAGYDLVRRYEVDPEHYHLPRSRRPSSSPWGRDKAMVERIKFWRTRKQKNRWGAKKIRAKLVSEHPDLAIPSVTTIHNILVREGLVKRRKRRRQVVAHHPVFDPTECNEIWSMDHKGKFYLGNRKRCSPLTVCDSYSRYLFTATGQYQETWRGVKRVLRRLFQEYGKPQYLHSDNGSAFASIQSPQGFGSLSYWLLDHGIEPVFSDPGHPTQNGRHERMHRDLKAECCSPPSWDLRVQNRKMNAFRREYNEVRPHESLDQRLPVAVHQPGNRAYRDEVKPAEYDAELRVFKVYKSGVFRLNGYEFVTVSRGLLDNYVGLKSLGNRVYEVYYRQTCLGYFQQGVDLQDGHYYLLRSDDDLPQRWRDRKARRRK